LKAKVDRIEKKFVWETTLAFKKYLIEQKGATSQDGMRISNIPIQHILETVMEERINPFQWVDFIEKQFTEVESLYLPDSSE
jgi:hypothetical protein